MNAAYYPPLPVPARASGQQMSYDGYDKVFFDCYDSEQMHTYLDADRKARSAPALQAIAFALETTEGLEFLRAWQHGEYDTIRREWPEALVAPWNVGCP